jgi:very-short-patch-repair endonuclease
MGGRGKRRSQGWAPARGEERQKDRSYTNARAREMRKNPTPAEKEFWRLLKELNGEDARFRFRRQVAIDHFVFDFGDYSARLLIEVDGPIHEIEEIQMRDRVKAAHAEKCAFKLLRLTDVDVSHRPDWVIEQVRAWHAAPHPQPPPRKGAGA